MIRHEVTGQRDFKHLDEDPGRIISVWKSAESYFYEFSRQNYN